MLQARQAHSPETAKWQFSEIAFFMTIPKSDRKNFFG